MRTLTICSTTLLILAGGVIWHVAASEGVRPLPPTNITAVAALAVPEPAANRPKVPGVLRLNLRERRETELGSAQIKVVERTVDWNVAETAIIICDMWDDHHCKIAAQRVGVMAPRMNQVLTAARDRGV